MFLADSPMSTPQFSPPGGQMKMACVPWYHAQSLHICDGKAGAPGIPGSLGSLGSQKQTLGFKP